MKPVDDIAGKRCDTQTVSGYNSMRLILKIILLSLYEKIAELKQANNKTNHQVQNRLPYPLKYKVSAHPLSTRS